MHEDYFLHRLHQEMKRAEECNDPAERLAHLEACRHYCKLLGLDHDALHSEEQSK
ncbi:MAG: hypothetical protein ABIQ32_07500 [Sphingomicrobium sp.]